VTVNEGSGTRPRKRGTFWVILAGILLVLAGLSLVNQGAWALHANDAITKAPDMQGRLLFSENNLDVWGVIYLVVGVLVTLAGLGVFFRARWAVWTGIIAGMVSVAIQFLWLFTPYWPSAIVSIGLAAIVVCILSAYGIPEEEDVVL